MRAVNACSTCSMSYAGPSRPAGLVQRPSAPQAASPGPVAPSLNALGQIAAQAAQRSFVTAQSPFQVHQQPIHAPVTPPQQRGRGRSGEYRGRVTRGRGRGSGRGGYSHAPPMQQFAYAQAPNGQRFTSDGYGISSTAPMSMTWRQEIVPQPEQENEQTCVSLYWIRLTHTATIV